MEIKKMTKRELSRKMSDMYWTAYWAGNGQILATTEYVAFLAEVDRKYSDGKISETFMRWVHEIDSRLSDCD